jgi:hypothetical protein
MASRNPITGDNWTKKDELAFNKRLFQENLSRYQQLSEEERGQTGPQHPGFGTSFAPDRWNKYADWLEKQGLKQEADAIREMVEDAPQEEATTQEFVVPDERKLVTDAEEGTPEYEQFLADIEAYESGTYADRGLEGNRKEDGSLMTEDEVVKRVKSDITGKEYNSSKAKYDDETEFNIAKIKEDFAKKREDRLAAEVEAMAKAEKEKKDAEVKEMIDPVRQSLEDILMSDRNANLEEQLEDKERAARIQKEADEAIAYEEEQMRQEKDLEDAFNQADLDMAMMEAGADQAVMEADYENREFPMSNMSDEDKGMFQYEKTSAPAEMRDSKAVEIITTMTGMNTGDAQRLLNALKGVM